MEKNQSEKEGERPGLKKKESHENRGELKKS